MKPIIAIHGIKKEFFNAPLKNYILTFDDGLYSQYYYLPLIKEIKTKKIFFIASGLIGYGEKRKKFDGNYLDFPDCFNSLSHYRTTGHKHNYMNLDELKDLILEIGKENIGCHSHSHIKYFKGSLFSRVSMIKRDIEEMLEWFEKNLQLRPTIYAYPHYIDDYFLTIILKDYGFTDFYGLERIEIEKEENILPFL